MGSFEDLTIIYNIMSMRKCVLRNQKLKPTDKLLEQKLELCEYDSVLNRAVELGGADSIQRMECSIGVSGSEKWLGVMLLLIYQFPDGIKI